MPLSSSNSAGAGTSEGGLEEGVTPEMGSASGTAWSRPTDRPESRVRAPEMVNPSS